jgi:hypothetical protein
MDRKPHKGWWRILQAFYKSKNWDIEQAAYEILLYQLLWKPAKWGQ